MSEKILTTAKEEFELYHKCMDKWGFTAQLIKLNEECGELIQAASKRLLADHHNETINEFPLQDELADVLIMVKQIAMYVGPEAVDSIAQSKLKRVASVLERVGNNNE